MTILSWGLATRIQKSIFLLSRTYAHGVHLATSHPPFFNGGRIGSPASSFPNPREAPLFRRFGVSMGGLSAPPLFLLVIMEVLQPPPLILLVIMVGLSFSPLPLLLLLFRWDYEAMAGSLHRPPVLAATPLTNVRVLPLTVSSCPILLGSSRNVLGGAASPPMFPLGLVLQCLLPPPHLRLWCLCQLLSLLLSVLPLFPSIDSL